MNFRLVSHFSICIQVTEIEWKNLGKHRTKLWYFRINLHIDMISSINYQLKTIIFWFFDSEVIFLTKKIFIFFTFMLKQWKALFVDVYGLLFNWYSILFIVLAWCMNIIKIVIFLPKNLSIDLPCTNFVCFWSYFLWFFILFVLFECYNNGFIFLNYILY